MNLHANVWWFASQYLHLRNTLDTLQGGHDYHIGQRAQLINCLARGGKPQGEYRLGIYIEAFHIRRICTSRQLVLNCSDIGLQLFNCIIQIGAHVKIYAKDGNVIL